MNAGSARGLIVAASVLFVAANVWADEFVVVDEAGRPIVDATVTHRRRAACVGRARLSGITHADGVCVIYSPWAAEHVVDGINAPIEPVAVVDLGAIQPAPPALAGRVFHADGTPAPDATVGVQYNDPVGDPALTSRR